MANFFAYAQLDMRTLDLYRDYQQTSYSNETSTTFRIGVDQINYSDVVGKNFVFDGQGTPYSGITTSVIQYTNGSQDFVFKNIRLPQEQTNYFAGQDPGAVKATLFAGSDTISGSKFNDYIDGYGGGDTIDGNGGNDTIVSGAGTNFIDGGTGTDLLVIGANFADTQFSLVGDTVHIAGPGFDNTVTNVEQFQFADRFLNGTGAVERATGLQPIYRFYDTVTNDHFYTTDANEAASIKANLPTFNYEGTPWATPAKGADTVDVFRFFDTATKTHFLTQDPNEAAMIKATLPSFTYEGVAFEAYASAGAPNTFALERFYNTNSHVHTYAVDANEVALIKSGAVGQGWIDEGASFVVHSALHPLA